MGQNTVLCIIKMITLQIDQEFNAIPVKVPAAFAADINKLIPKCKEPRITKTILKKKNKTGKVTHTDFKIPYKTTQYTRQCGAGLRAEREINGAELIVQN